MTIKTFAARCVALAFAALASTAANADALPAIRVTEDFAEIAVNWDDGFGKGYVGRVQVFAVNGVMVLCGAGSYVSAANRSPSRTFLKCTKLKMNGKTILKDLTYFTPVDRVEDVIGAEATCKSTGVAEPRGDATFEFDFGIRGVRF